jgi:hypothetical protein
MKAIATLTTMTILALTVSLAAVEQKQKPAAKNAPGRQTLSAVVVSVDTTGQKLVVKDDKNAETTLAVKGKAVSMLSELKTGDKVTVSVRSNKKGTARTAFNIRLMRARDRIKKDQA